MNEMEMLTATVLLSALALMLSVTGAVLEFIAGNWIAGVFAIVCAILAAFLTHGIAAERRDIRGSK